MLCPLCQHNKHELILKKTCPQSGQRHYYLCSHCDLIFIPQDQQLNFNEQKQHYDHHQNNNNDPGYQKFIRQATDPLLRFLKPNDKILDFGCGPGPVVKTLLQNHDVAVFEYDPLYKRDDSLLDKKYDALVCTEVVEHFCEAQKSWAQLFSLCKPGAHLAIMTQTHLGPARFANWWYHRDPTHVCFYSSKTWEHLAGLFNAKIIWQDKNTAIFKAFNRQHITNL